MRLDNKIARVLHKFLLMFSILPNSARYLQVGKGMTGGDRRKFSELMSGLGAGMGQALLSLPVQEQAALREVSRRQKEMALHAAGSRSVNLLTKGCCGCEKLAWIQGEFTENKSSESY